jgi:hypothetical protein
MTFDEAAYRKITRLAKRAHLSKSEFARRASMLALGVEVTGNSGNTSYEEFSDEENQLIINLYKKVGPTQLAREIEERWGKNRLPSTISNKALELGVRRKGIRRKVVTA